jgi:PD-(D/E)XK nuclease superfamily
MSHFFYEHKTTSEDISPGSSYWLRVTTVDPQITLYVNGLRAIGIDCRGIVYDVLRKPAHRPSSKGETPEHFEKRVLAAISEDPARYYQRSNPVRLTGELRECEADVWQTSVQIGASHLTNAWPRNHDACMQWGRACDFFGVCSNTADIEDPVLFVKGSLLHDELSAPANDAGGKELLTQSSLRCYRACPKRYYFRYVLGMKPLKYAAALRTGTSIHNALNEWMRTGGDLKAALSKLDTFDLYANARERAMIIGYHARWDLPPKVIAVEREWQSELKNPETGVASSIFRLGGKADLVVAMDDEQAREQREPSLAPLLEESLRLHRGNV